MPEESESFVHGDAARLFLNTELGCASSCSYCYLPAIGMPTGARGGTRRASAADVLRMLAADPRFVPGRAGTLLSIGCFSECWDARNRVHTAALVSSLSQHGNRIQIATKRRIHLAQLEPLLILPGARQQLKIYISSATISRWSEFELGTSRPDVRFKSFEACAELDVEAFLYIKPVLPGITIKDINAYGDIMQRHRVCAIVGDRFDMATHGQSSPISKQLRIVENDDTTEIRNQLRRFGRVFDNSSQTIVD